MTVKGAILALVAGGAGILANVVGFEIPSEIQLAVATGVIGIIGYGLKRASINPGK